MCYADRANTLLVNTDGNIFKCTAVDFENAANDSNIFSDTWKQDLSTKFEKRLKKRFANHNPKQTIAYSPTGRKLKNILSYQSSRIASVAMP